MELSNKKDRTKHLERGFTLIELLTVTAILGVLAGLSLRAVTIYRADAAYSVIEKTLHDAKVAFEAGVTTEPAPDTIALTAQTTQGLIVDPAARAVLPGMQIPKNSKIQVEFDNACNLAGCQVGMLQVDHCFANEFTRWTRFGDGVEVQLDNVAGGNCN